MRLQQIIVFLGAVLVARCATPAADADEASTTPSAAVATDPEPTVDQIREKLAAIPADTVEELDKLATAIADGNPGIRPDSNEIRLDLASDKPGDEISSRFWYWKKKNPVHHQLVHDDEALDHSSHHGHYEEKPALIKPIVDKFKKPLIAALQKPTEIVSNLLTKPHDLVHDIKKPILHKPVEAEYEPSHDEVDDRPSILDHIKKPIGDLLHKPVEIAEQLFHKPLSHHTIQQDSHHDADFVDHIKKPVEALLHKPIEIASEIINKPHQQHLAHNKIGILDGIKEPVEGLLNEPAEIATDILSKPIHKPSVLDKIKEPIEALLHKPAELASHFINKPLGPFGILQHFENNKPSIIDHIKKPIESLIHKPVFSNPETSDSIIHFPIDSLDYNEPNQFNIFDKVKPNYPHESTVDEEPFGALSDIFHPQPLTGSYAGVHLFQPNYGFNMDQTRVQNANQQTPQSLIKKKNPSTVEHPTRYQEWVPSWEMQFPRWPQPSPWVPKPWNLPHSANYGIPSGSYVRGLETDSTENMYEKYPPGFPYGTGRDYIFI